MYIKCKEMKRTQYAQSSHARVNQTGLCGVIGERKRKRKSGQSRNIKEKKERKKERMINAECRDMDNPVNITKTMTCCIDS